MNDLDRLDFCIFGLLVILGASAAVHVETALACWDFCALGIYACYRDRMLHRVRSRDLRPRR